MQLNRMIIAHVTFTFATASSVAIRAEKKLRLIKGGEKSPSKANQQS